MTTLVLLRSCGLLDNCSVQIQNKCSELPVMESTLFCCFENFSSASVLLILGQNGSDSAVCRLKLCIFQSYCNLFHAYSLNIALSLEKKERQLSRYLWCSGYDFLRLFKCLFHYNCLNPFFLSFSPTLWFFSSGVEGCAEFGGFTRLFW